MTDTRQTSDPLTFADFLPDDRSPERVRCEELQAVIAAHMRSSEGDSWLGWQQLMAAHQGETEVDRALFDLALRKELVASRDHAPTKPVLGLIFTAMDWWYPKGDYEKRATELDRMVNAFGIAHLCPEPEPGERVSDDSEPGGGKGNPIGWLLFAIALLIILLA